MAINNPTGTTATNIHYTGFTANWSLAPTATGYSLYISTVSNFSSHVTGFDGLDVDNVSTYVTNSFNIETATDYYYRLKAYNSDEYSDYSNVISLTTLTHPFIDTPTATTASNISYNSFNANWLSVPDASGYTIDVSTNSNFTSYIYENIDVGDVSTYIINNEIEENLDYFYRLKAYNSGATSNYSNIIEVTTILSPPDAPTATTATSITQTSFYANWLALSEITPSNNGIYFIDVSESISFSSYVSGWQNVNCELVTTRLINSNIVADTLYYYRVRGQNDFGLSDNSNTITTTTLPNVPGTPISISATNISDNNFKVNWTEPTFEPYEGAVTGYKIDISTDITFSTFLSGYENRDVGLVTYYDILNLDQNTNYYHRTNAYNTGGESTESNITSITTLKSSPLSMFYADTTNTLTGQSINFFDISTNLPTSWLWTFESGTPGSSILQNPTIFYYSAGTFDVNLTVTNNGGNDDEYKIGYIQVYDKSSLSDVQVLKFNDKIVRSYTIDKILIKDSSATQLDVFENLYYSTLDSTFGQFIDSNSTFNFLSGESFAYGCYFKTTDSTTQYLFSKDITDSSGHYWLKIENGILLAGLGFSGKTTKYTDSSSGSLLNDGNWHHVMAILNIDDNELQLYVDKTKIAFTTITEIDDIYNLTNLYIGRQSSNFFNGSIDEIVLVKGDVDAIKVNGLAGNSVTNCGDANKVFTDDDLLIYYRLEESIGSVALNDGTSINGTITNNPTWSSH